MDKRWTALIPSKSRNPASRYTGQRLIGCLPEEAYLAILFHLDVPDTVNLARTCRKVAALSTDERVWSRKLAALRWSGPQPSREAERLVERIEERKRQQQQQQRKDDASATNNNSNRNSLSLTTPLPLSTSAERAKQQVKSPTRASGRASQAADDDGFGDFIDFSGSSDAGVNHRFDAGKSSIDARLSSTFDNIDLIGASSSSSQQQHPSFDPESRRDEDLLMLFDDDNIEDISLATASPAKPKKPAISSTSRAVSSAMAGSTTKYASPAPSLDLFVVYYRFLLPFFRSLQTQTTSSLVFTSLDVRTHLARAQLLSTLSRFLSPNLAPTRQSATLTLVRRNLQSASDFFEASLLSAFEQARDHNNLQAMRDAAVALWELNGGQSVVQIYMNKIPLLYEQLDSSYDPLRNLTRTMGPEGYPVDGIDFSHMDNFMSHVLETGNREGEVITRVFPSNTDVLVTLADRIATEVVGRLN